MGDQTINILLIEPKMQAASRLIQAGSNLHWTHVLRVSDALALLDRPHDAIYAIIYILDRIDITPSQRQGLDTSGSAVLSLRYPDETAMIISSPNHPDPHYVPLDHPQTADLLYSSITALVASHQLQAEQRRLQQYYADMERQFSQMILDNPDGILIIDGQGHIAFANQQAARIFDTTIDKLVGRDFGYPLTTGEMTSINIHHHDNGIIYVEMQARPTTWQSDKATMALLRDVTPRKHEEDRLYQTRLLHVSVFNALSERIAVVDTDGLIIATNRAWDDAARRNGDPELKSTGIGADYFSACRHATGEMSSGAVNALQGMLDVLHGRRELFEMEYQDIENNAPEWYMMRVTRLRDAFDSGLVVVHSNISYGKQTAREQAESEAALSLRQRREQELATLREMGEQALMSRSTTTLRTSSPDVFAEIVQRFETLLHRAFEQRTHKIADPISDDLRRLADYLGTLRIGPREVMDLYLAALKRSTEAAPPPKVQAYTEEGRIMVLELMGYLATFYRDALPPTVRLSPL